MEYGSFREAEDRLRNTDPLSEEEVVACLPWMANLSQGTLARLQAHLGLANVRAIRNLNDTSATIEGAVRRMDESSERMGGEGLRLNKALFWWTIIGVVVSTVIGICATWIALASYKAADASSAQQQQTLDASRKSLEATVAELNRLTSIADTQQKELEVYQKQVLAKPDLIVKLEAPFEQAKPTVQRMKLSIVTDLFVPYGKPIFLIAMLQNVGGVPAHNVHVTIEATNQVENAISDSGPFEAIPGSNLVRIGNYELPTLYSGTSTTNFSLPVRIKADAQDYTAQVFIHVDGTDLRKPYQGVWRLRKK